MSKEAIKRLQSVFSPSSDPLHSLNLPIDVANLIDAHLSQFAASFPTGGMGGHQRETEGERERARWREGLLEIWGGVEPLPGSEGDPIVIARVSAFLVLLEKLSAGLGEDDDSALINRRDIGTVWWSVVLRRTMLGTAQESNLPLSERGRKGPRPTQPLTVGSVRPLTTSRMALEAATRMVIWAMSPSLSVPDHLADAVTPFGLVVFTEYEERAGSMLKGQNEGYGVRNLEECIIGWGAACPRAFFLHISPSLSPSPKSRLPSLSLLLAFLSRHSGRAYHALRTPLLTRLNLHCLGTASPADVSLGIKCLAIFLVTLPVIIGSSLVGVMAVYGRVVCWERLVEDVPERSEVEDPTIDSTQDLSPPDPMVLFTVLYGVYPCNFLAFLRDATNYLKEKGWKGVADDMEYGFDTATVRDRSKHLVRSHTLHPSLLATDLTAELTDTNRWRQFESADVMAECDRNVAHFGSIQDPRGNFLPALENATEESAYFDLTQSPKSNDKELPEHNRVTQLSGSPNPSQSRSRSPIPHLPSTTHFTNFQALQSSPRRSSSMSSDYVDPLSLSSQLGITISPIGSIPSSTATSRRGSFTGNSSAFMSRTNSNNKIATGSTNTQIVRLETELMLLQSEVNFQTYLKQLHLAHMGTLHREKVLDSGAEAERQSLYRTIRTLRASSKQTKITLDKLRIESSSTKVNWIEHIEDLKEKLKSLRENRLTKEAEGNRLVSELKEVNALVIKQAKELEEQGAAFFDLENQVSFDAVKLARIVEYEARIEALMKTLAICDEDLCKFVEQRNQMEKLVGEWKKSDLLLDSAREEITSLKTTLIAKEDEIIKLKAIKPLEETESSTSLPRDDMSLMRLELERLREKCAGLEEENIELKM